MSFWDVHADDRDEFDRDLLIDEDYGGEPEQLELFDRWENGLTFGEWMENLPQ